jgi:hypothetical protein
MGVMIRKFSIQGLVSIVSTVAFAGLVMGCEVGGVGDPCIPEDEYTTGFSGFSVEEVNVESRSFQCETRICLVNHFQGRVSCPYGNKESTVNLQAAPEPENPPGCFIPDNDDPVVVPVAPQLSYRRASDSVYCSCRCDGPDPNARYCECPSGFRCERLVEDLNLGSAQLVGSYCVREGTVYTANVQQQPCRYSAIDGCQGPGTTGCTGNEPPETQGNCGPVDARGAPE